MVLHRLHFSSLHYNKIFLLPLSCHLKKRFGVCVSFPGEVVLCQQGEYIVKPHLVLVKTIVVKPYCGWQKKRNSKTFFVTSSIFCINLAAMVLSRSMLSVAIISTKNWRSLGIVIIVIWNPVLVSEPTPSNWTRMSDCSTGIIIGDELDLQDLKIAVSDV